MYYAAVTLSLLLAILALAQTVLARQTLARLRWSRPSLIADEECPKAMVILPLRGKDPFLRDTLRAILAQDYPDYALRVIIDSRDDPAWTITEQCIAESRTTRVSIESLTSPLTSCSLKNSSLLQALATLDDSHQILAILDSDAVPHETWLREFATALADPQVAAATGNRWYIPADRGLGSMVRSTWNLGAVIMMVRLGFSWGGALALKTSVIRDTDLKTHWSKALTEDTVLDRILRERKLKSRFVPSLIMVNRERCSLQGFLQWCPRQLLLARLYHPNWPIILLHAISTSATLGISLTLAIATLAVGNNSAFLWIAGGLILHETTAWILALLMTDAVNRTLAAKNEAVDRIGPAMLARLLFYIPVTQALYTIVVALALFKKSTVWRDIEYRIDGPWNIRLIEYQPFRSDHAQKNVGNTSL